MGSGSLREAGTTACRATACEAISPAVVTGHEAAERQNHLLACWRVHHLGGHDGRYLRRAVGEEVVALVTLTANRAVLLRSFIQIVSTLH